MKTFISMITSVLLLATGVASATCPNNNCFNSFNSVEVGGTAVFGGYGAGVFEGTDGHVQIQKSGYAVSETTLAVSGNTCGTNCQSGSFTFTGAAGEVVNSAVWASGSKSGKTVSAINEGAALSGVGFSFGKNK